MSRLEAVVLTEFPRGAWWMTGLRENQYHGDDNKRRCIRAGLTPDQDVGYAEHSNVVQQLLVLNKPFVVLRFPDQAAQLHLWDSLFNQDHGIVMNGYGILLSQFGEKRRQKEVEIFSPLYEGLGIPLHRLDCPEAALEGGDVIYDNKRKIFLAGIESRNNQRGIDAFSEFSGYAGIPIRSGSFHIDTITALLHSSNESGEGLFVYVQGTIQNIEDVERFVRQHGYKPFQLNASELGFIFRNNGTTLYGPDGKEIQGESMVGNFLQTNSHVLSPHKISTPGFYDELGEIGLTHIVTPQTQYIMFASGGNRCAGQVVTVDIDMVKSAFQSGIVKAFYFPGVGLHNKETSFSGQNNLSKPN